MRIRHLSTEELLLQCEGELGFERASHLDECEACRTALVNLVELLGDAEQELCATVPSETAVEHAAAWDAIAQQISKPATVITFPVRWAGAYAAAAALGFAVFSGVMESDFFSPGSDAVPVMVAEAPVLEPPTVTPLPQLGVAQQTAPAASAVETAPPATKPREAEPVVAASVKSTPMVAEQRVLDRYASEAGALPANPAETASPFLRAPIIAGLRPLRTPSMPPTAAALMEAPVAEPTVIERQPLTLAAAREVVEGHWILHRAKVWREDVAPAWTDERVVFTGTVENEQVRNEVTTAIRSVDKAGRVPIELQLRAVSTGVAGSAVSAPIEQGIPGGVVRTSLLEHYSDAARRSFASTEASALEGELDRFMNEVFENQSNLLAHAYELKMLTSAVPANLVSEVGSSSRFADLAAVHANAVRRHQTRIYDLLSEVLPRKYWTYKAKDESASSGDLQVEATALLEDALELDANLTAILSTPRHLLDAGDANVSCGEALSRIRTRLKRIKADTAKLR